MPSTLDIIARDSTHYFVLIFFSQLLAQLFVLFAPVSDTRYVRGWLLRIVLTTCTFLAWNSALTGGVSSFALRRRSDLRVTYIDINFRRANSVLVPVMASRLMLSLKKAAAQPKIPWSLKTMTIISQGRITEGGIINSPPRVPGEWHEISRVPAAPNEGGVELCAMHRSTRNR